MLLNGTIESFQDRLGLEDVLKYFSKFSGGGSNQDKYLKY